MATFASRLSGTRAVGLACVVVGLAGAGAEGGPSSRTIALPGWAVPRTIEMRRLRDGRVRFEPGPLAVPIAGASADDGAFVLDPVSLTLNPALPPIRPDDGFGATRCEEWVTSLPTGITLDSTRVVRLGERPLEVRGSVRRIGADPSANWLVVMSAIGVPLPSWSPLPALGRRDQTIGWRYHQAFSLPDGVQHGATVALGIWLHDPLICFVPGEPVVAYSDARLSSVTLIRLQH